MTRAPRIDTVRNRLTATTELLALIHAELADLHLLAYDRATAARDVTVQGGTRDWALDTHGDPRARAAYRALAEAAINASTNLAEASHNAIRLLREANPGEPTSRTRRLIDQDELVTALAAQARRDTRGDYVPHRSQPQPGIDAIKQSIDRIIRERDTARAQADKLARRLEQYEPPTTGRRRRRRRSA